MAKKLKLLKSKTSQQQPEPKKTAGTAVKKVVASAGKVEPKNDPEKVLNVGELDSLIGDAADAEADTRGFMQPQSTVKKRGRKSNAQKAAEAQAAQATTAETVAPPVEEKLDCAPIAKMAWGLTNKWWVSYIGDNRVSATDAEIDMLGAAWGKVLEKHLPTALATWGEEIIAMTVTVNIGLRISNSVQLLVEEKKAQREAYVARHAQSASQPQASAVQ